MTIFLNLNTMEDLEVVEDKDHQVGEETVMEILHQ
jgi:hypothetical protein